MDAYMYRAALYCVPCGNKIKAALTEPDIIHDDSDHYPQGPYANGGGEADTPQHCDTCRCFLQNPLTLDGAIYVREQIDEFVRSGSGDWNVLRLWAEHYIIKPQFYECGICGALHPANWNGDCRDDANRFHTEQLDAKYGESNWEEVETPETGHAERDEFRYSDTGERSTFGSDARHGEPTDDLGESPDY